MDGEKKRGIDKTEETEGIEMEECGDDRWRDEIKEGGDGEM